jgi:NADH:ubiquinone oxidoreductase subunit E
LIAYVRYVEDTTIKGDLLFCNPIRRRATAKELFKFVDMVKEKSIKWSDSVGVCTAAARVMEGNEGSLQDLIKRSAPEAVWAHRMVHRESDCVGVCTAAAHVMEGNKESLQDLIKRSEPEAVWTHCMVHSERWLRTNYAQN